VARMCPDKKVGTLLSIPLYNGLIKNYSL